MPANGIVLWFEVFWIFHMNFELCSAFLSDDFNYTELIIVFDIIWLSKVPHKNQKRGKKTRIGRTLGIRIDFSEFQLYSCVACVNK